MSILKAVILGIIQGIAEFLPVSSSGHLLVTRNLMDLGDIPVLFDILLHVATLIVVIFVFRERVIALLHSLFRWMIRKSDESDKSNLKMIILILVATFFTGVIGIVINDLEFFQNPKVVSIFFIVTAVILWLTRYVKPRNEYSIPGPKEGILLGIAQGFGVIPGISRSGITISAALLGGIDRKKAGEISFIISIPAIIGAFLIDLKDGAQLMSEVSYIAVIAGFITTMIVGYFSLILLMKLIKSGRFYLFSFYLLPLGVIGFFFLT
ncbi:MAG: undecaprenyl-diphosphate phosphatase [Spirochaetaceae bacterium]|nr:undecaprenyl-diphosphate phosphatase [Spirochaetaceae bacterium]